MPDYRKLVKRCKKNDREAQSELFYTFKDSLFALCLKYCNNYEEAEDVLQDSFLKIFKSINQYKGKGSFEGWLKRVVINNAISRYKKKTFTHIPINEELVCETKIDEDSLYFSIDELLGFIQQLPEKYRLVFNLYELDDYSHKEIAEMLEISEGTSKSNLHRAKLLLKKMILSVTHNNKIAVNNG